MLINQFPHRRLNPLTGQWLLVSPHRTRRPWLGMVEQPVDFRLQPYDPRCYLCPGNARAGGVLNPQYRDVFVFTNDFASLLAGVPELRLQEGDLLQAASEQGICRVVCFSPRHDLTLSLMSTTEIQKVIEAWIEEYQSLGGLEYIRHVQIFENRGEMMGCSNPHPHGQIWAQATIPELPAQEQMQQRRYLEQHSSCLLCDYAELELARGERVVFENNSFVCLVPFWAVWPFETMLLPKTHVTAINQLDVIQREDLADAMRRLGIRYDNLFRTSFPYSMGIHQSPTDGDPHPEWHLHLHYLPPLLRSASIRKFMVGYELLAMPQRDITPEQSAERLRECSETHYLDEKP
ncbi:MAG: UDP-glucose--hexose-1-phosphate uridylyltransferase [Bradymonadales bacterium]|nr:UDP-glucose--hexose-1-phosphate uridylyltransferase [Bradymonadales bacterium]